MKKSKIICFSLMSLFVVPLTFSCNSISSECLTIKSNYKDYVLKNTNVDDYKFKPIDKIKEELESVIINGVETYKFKDIDYKNDYIRGSWPALNHLNRTVKIAIVAESKNSDELKDIAKKLTLHWVYSNYRNINWWQNELGANSVLANLGLFVFNNLGAKGQAAFNGKIRESSLKYRPSLLTHVGANVFDYIDITCRNAAINNDKEEMDIAFNRLKEEITNDKTEGFQKDGSFFQHGRQVQNVSYGKSVIRVGKTLYNLRGANYTLPEDKIKIISDYILSGLRYSTFKGYTNYSTVSREYTRPNNLDTQANGFKDLGYFLDIGNYPNKADTYNYIDSISKRSNPIKDDSVKYFGVAKMIVCNIGHTEDNPEGVYISYKGTEPNLTNTECVNGENRLGLNMSYGTNTCVMDTGTEYFNISPYWDYSHIPGTTSPSFKNVGTLSYISDDDNLFYYVNSVYNDNLYEWKVPAATSSNFYVYNDGQDTENNITFSMTRSKHHDRSSYTVTCFATNDGMVLTGSNFAYERKDNDPTFQSEHCIDPTLYTTVDQYVTVDDTEGTSSEKSFVNHSKDDKGHITYKSLTNDNLTKTIKKISIEKSDWNRNNSSMNVESAPVGEKYIATITVPNTNGYAYEIVPTENVDKFEFIDVVNPDPSRTEAKNFIHAIKFGNKIAAAFYDKEYLEFVFDNKTYSVKDEFSEEKFVGKGIFKVFDIK